MKSYNYISYTEGTYISIYNMVTFAFVYYNSFSNIDHEVIQLHVIHRENRSQLMLFFYHCICWSPQICIGLRYTLPVRIDSHLYHEYIWFTCLIFCQCTRHLHDDVMTWKRFLHFLRGIHQWLVNSPQKRCPRRGAPIFFPGHPYNC